MQIMYCRNLFENILSPSKKPKQASQYNCRLQEI